MQEIFTAIKALDTRRVEELLRSGADPNQIKDEHIHMRPLHVAVLALDEGGPIDILRLLIRHGADINGTYPDIGGGTPLLIALFNDLLEVANFLLGVGADPNVMSEEGDSALHWCADNNNLEMANMLLEKGAWKTIDKYSAIEGRTALGMAIHRLKSDMVKLLLNAGASPDVIDFNKDTAKECLPLLNESNKFAWNEIAALLDPNHIKP